MAKKKEYTFADEAQKIMKRFPRRETDPIEKRDYEQAMQELQQEQEMVRQQMGLTQPQEGMPQEFKCGGKMKYPTGGFMIPTDLQNSFIQHAATLQDYSNPQQISSFDTPDLGQGISYGASSIPLSGSNLITPMAAGEVSELQKEAQRATPLGTKLGDAGRTLASDENLPYYASGASNILSNLLLANMAKKNQPRMSAAMATPERINLEPQAEALRGQAGVAKNIASRNARNVGLNPMQAMASMSAAGTGVDRNLGDALTNLYMQQEGANVGAANQFALSNAQNQNRANMVNAQLDQQALNQRLGFLEDGIGTLPGVMKDIRQDKADKEMRDIWSRYSKSVGRNYQTGDIFSEEGFDWKVKGYDKDGNIIKEKIGKTKDKDLEKLKQFNPYAYNLKKQKFGE